MKNRKAKTTSKIVKSATTPEQNHADAVKYIPAIVNRDIGASFEKIQYQLKTKYSCFRTFDEIQTAIDEITSDHEKSFVVCDQVKKGHAVHMYRLMLLVTKHRKIKSCRLVVDAGNGAKYSVKFWGGNGAILETWFGVNMSEKYVAYGTDHLCSAMLSFETLADRAEIQASTIAWIISEFEGLKGQKMAVQVIDDFKLTIPFPTPDQLNTFSGFKASGTLIGNKVIHGTITPSHTQPEHVGIESTLFHSWNNLISITINTQF